MKDYAESQGLAYRITEKKLPAPPKDRLIQLVRAYLTKKKIEDVVRENCYGCQYDMPSQRDHVCLDEEAGDAYKHVVQLEDVAEKISTVVKAMGL